MTTKEFKARPLSDRVVVRPPDEEKVTESGIIIPDTAERELPDAGEVVAIGPGWVDRDGNVHPITSVKVGETVYFGRHAGYELEINGETMKILREMDILLVD